ncbi:MAG: response regulator transcription factor [Saccharothrix sp.]|nr:response regulator transcription factor [Saccharothrix sp.]
MTPARLLVVDDEEPLADLLVDALGFAGYAVDVVHTGGEALTRARADVPDLVVLDVNLPDVDGFEVCRRLRRDGHDVPVLFLTARDDPADLRTGFTGGGDDYLTKPFRLEELRLRVAAILRRSRRTGDVLGCGPLTLDREAHEVRLDGAAVHLSTTEYRLLEYLAVNRDRVLSRTQILDRVWGPEYAGDAQVVATYVSYLRRKLDPGGDLIRTVRGVGYRLSVRP